jgi:DNA-directed RNA polymerase specialized sigma subunit
MKTVIAQTTVAAAQAGDRKATEQIITSLEGMRTSLVSKTMPQHLFDDGMSVALEANWLAIGTYDADHGAEFTTHAYTEMRFALLKEASQSTTGPTVSHAVAHRYRQLMKQTDQDVNEAAMIADTPGVNFSAATFMAAHDALAPTSSLETAYETLDYDARSVEDTALANVELDRLLSILPYQQAAILMMAYGLGGVTAMTDAEIGEAIGLPRLTVQRRRAAALAAMKLAA